MPTAADLLRPFLFLVGNFHFVDITFLDTLVDPLFYTDKRPRTVKTCYDCVRAGTGDPWEQVFLKRGIKGGTTNSLLRRDCFDLMVLTGPHKMFTWNGPRICYIRSFYPNHPVPGHSPGYPCYDLQHHVDVTALFTAGSAVTIPMVLHAGELHLLNMYYGMQRTI
jgi:hypothetical protein